MVILALISSCGYYGAESVMLGLARGLEAAGCRCIVAVLETPDGGDEAVARQAEQRGLQVRRLACSGRWDWRTIRELCVLLEQEQVDILHSHGYKADVYGWLASCSTAITLVATCHNWPDPHPLMRAYAKLDQAVLRRFQVVAGVSQDVISILTRAGVRAPVLVPNGVEIERFHEATPTLDPELSRSWDRVVGFVGRAVQEKGGADLLHAARIVLNRRPATGFAFVGDGPELPHWKSLAEHLAIAKNVRFLGAREDMPGVYASFDLLVLPSLVEAQPMCLLEALASGVPVVATRVGGVGSLVVDGHSGLLVEVGDIQALADSILLLLGDPYLARSLARQGHSHVALHHSLETMACAYLELYALALRKVPSKHATAGGKP